MHVGKLVFAQVMEFAPWHTFRRSVAKYRGDFNVRTFSCFDQFLCMAFAQLTYRETLRDIEACLGAQPAKLYHLGIRGNVTRSNLGDANETRDWRIHCEFAQALTGRRLLRHAGQIELQVQAHLLHSGGSQHGTHLRSAGRTDSVLLPAWLSRERLRRIRFKDPETGKTLVFLTNHFGLPALTICTLYKSRWQVELFFK